CGKVNGHSDDCKFAAKKEAPKAEVEKKPEPKPEKKAEPAKKAQSVYLVTAAAKKNSKSKGDYLFVSVTAPDNTKGALYVWDPLIVDLFLSRTYEKPLRMRAE